MERKQYGATLASFYDALNDGVDYEAVCDLAEDCFARYLGHKPSYICETACGTGSTAIGFAKRGYKVIASDISEEMLAVAEKKAREADAELRFVKADMRRFELYSKVDAVLCFLDSVNYLLKKEDVCGFFGSVNAALVDGGLFIFDANTRHKFETVYADNAYIIENEGILCAWQNYYNENTRMCDFYLSFFSEDEDGRYTRVDEDQRERMYTVRQFVTYLEESGFEVMDILTGNAGEKADENRHDRMYFVCKKKTVK